MNKKLLGAILIVTIWGTNSLAIDFMGPPTAGLKEGQWKLGYTHHQSKSDIEVENIRVSGIDYENINIEDIETTRNYFTFNYGTATDRMEIYGFLGAADTESDSYDFGSESIQFSGNSDFAFGIGTKVTTNIYNESDWGILFQVSWLKSDDTLDNVKVEIDAYELQVALGPTVKMTKDWKIYGGPFIYKLGGDIDTTNPKGHGDLKEDSAIGGYIGTQIDFFGNAAIAAEYASTGDSSGFGVNVSWKF